MACGSSPEVAKAREGWYQLLSVAGPKTKVMQQHAAAKRAHPDAILFFRLGDFYEMFGEDALLAARALDLTLTSRNKGSADEIPMAGVPHHAAHGYIARLLGLGHKVAICEQMADPALTRGIVPREVVRVVTPGLVTDGEHLDARTNNWLAALDLGTDGVAIALLDFSTGELQAASVRDLAALLGEIVAAAPREILVGVADPQSEELENMLGQAIAALTAALPASAVRTDPPLDAEARDAALGSLASETQGLAAGVVRAVGRVLRFARNCNPQQPLPVRRIGTWEPSSTLKIDATAQLHLELVQSGSGNRAATLLGVLDSTRSPMGARLLRRRLLGPLTEVERIRRRLDEVELFVQNPRLREQLRAALGRVGDLERLSVRTTLGEATPRDLGALRDGLHAAREAAELVTGVSDLATREVLGVGGETPDLVSELAEKLSLALVDRPPAHAKEGQIFRSTFDPELASLDSLRQSGSAEMVALETRLRDSSGIPTLKVRFTRVFGWYVEVSRSHTARVPEGWRRKQTVAGGERYTLPELDELADRILHAEERHRERELHLLGILVEGAAAESQRICHLAALLGNWDVAAALAETAHRLDYTRPAVDSADIIEIADGRHPVVERLAAEGRFVPNDVRLDLSAERMWLITGPNMAGKSTVLRQVALTVILAQVGSFVPARSARVGVVDRVLSRVGASDNLAAGESTFMVEMRETAAILRSATRRSLVILDEIGRGTSTFDGLAIAWAVAEYLDDVVGCRTLFATHYHELTALAESSDHAANYSVSAKELGDDLVFLHRLVPGAVSRSYGVQVAKLAGLPESVLARARAVLHLLEDGKSPERGAPAVSAHRAPRKAQLDLFEAPRTLTSPERETVDTLRLLEVERLTPLDALALLAQLQRKLR